MRRILRKIVENDLDNIGDTSTLLNPECVEKKEKSGPGEIDTKKVECFELLNTYNLLRAQRNDYQKAANDLNTKGESDSPEYLNYMNAVRDLNAQIRMTDERMSAECSDYIKWVDA